MDVTAVTDLSYSMKTRKTARTSQRVKGRIFSTTGETPYATKSSIHTPYTAVKDAEELERTRARAFQGEHTCTSDIQATISRPLTGFSSTELDTLADDNVPLPSTATPAVLDSNQDEEYGYDDTSMLLDNNDEWETMDGPEGDAHNVLHHLGDVLGER